MRRNYTYSKKVLYIFSISQKDLRRCEGSLKEIYTPLIEAKHNSQRFQITTVKTRLLSRVVHMGQNSKQIDIAKYVSKFLICCAKMLDKCAKSQKKFFVHCPFLQSQAK